AQKYRYFGFYAQDDWRISRKLTVNLGVRYDFTLPPVNAKDEYSDFNPTRQPWRGQPPWRALVRRLRTGPRKYPQPRARLVRRNRSAARRRLCVGSENHYPLRLRTFLFTSHRRAGERSLCRIHRAVPV